MDALAQFDGDVNVRVPKAKGEKPAAPLPVAGEAKVPNGIFTLEFPCGTSKTFRIHRKRDNAKFAPGKRLLSLLIGPDNSSDWEAFAFVTDETITVWRNKSRSRSGVSKYEEYADLLWSLTALGEQLEGYTLHVAKHCMRCNRLLTTVESIALGLGPECAKFAR